jgi:hypothetical protein
MARTYRPGDRVFAFTDKPDLVISLVCTPAQQWGITVFDFASKKASITGHAEPSLEQAKRFATSFVAEHYQLNASSADWREVLVIRPSGPAG